LLWLFRGQLHCGEKLRVGCLSGCVRKAGIFTVFYPTVLFFSGAQGMIEASGATSLTVSSYITTLASTVVALVLVTVG